MDYKVLYRKYRPDDFSSIIGQDYMTSILRNSIKNSKISHAYIFRDLEEQEKLVQPKFLLKP